MQEGLKFTEYIIDGVAHTSPRRMMWCTEQAGMEYRFSANHVPGLAAHPLTPSLRRIQRDVIKACGGDVPYNAVLINIYDDGTEYSGWHCDNDPWLGDTFAVPSVSLGAERDFCVREKVDVAGTAGEADVDPTACVLRMRLAHGSLCLMDGRFQHEYEHSVPAEADTEAAAAPACTSAAGTTTPPRLNLTWRYVLPGRERMHNLKPRWDSP